MSSPRTLPAACETKARLSLGLREVHDRITDLDRREVELVLGRDYDYQALAELDQQLVEARARREQAMLAMRRHVAEHGC
jgi:hypothetical protein